MRILCTGGLGFIGSHVVDSLVVAGHEVMVIDDLSSGHMDNWSDDIRSSIIFLNRTISYSEANVRLYKPEILIHLAAQPSLLESIKHPFVDAEINILETLRLLEWSKDIGVKHFIFASTSAVYNDEVDLMTEESTKYGMPCSPYGLSKLTAETYVRMLLPDTSIAFRFANIYGPRQRPLGENQVIPRAINRMLHGTEFLVHSNGRHMRDFMYVADVVTAINLAIQDDAPTGIYNLASGKSTSVWDLLTMLKEVSEWNGDWETIDKVMPDRLAVEMSNAKYQESFGITEFVSLQEGLKETVEWHKNC